MILAFNAYIVHYYLSQATDPFKSVSRKLQEWTVPQLSIMIIYNCTQSILIQQIRMILSADNLAQKIQKKAYFLFVIILITRSKKNLPLGEELQNYNIMPEPHTLHDPHPLKKILFVAFQDTKFELEIFLMREVVCSVVLQWSFCFN